METTRTSAGRGKTTRAPSRTTPQAPPVAGGRVAGTTVGSSSRSFSTTTTQPPVQVSTSSSSQVPARQSLRDASPPTATPLTQRPARTGEAGARSEVRSLGGLPVEQMEVPLDHKASLAHAPLTRDTARALLRQELRLHLMGQEVRDACTMVYDLCRSRRLDPECIQLLMRTMLEEHAPNALRGANAAMNLLGYIAPIVPTMEDSIRGVRHILVHMMVGVAQAMARPGEPALSDHFLAQAAVAIVTAPKALKKDDKSHHPDGQYFQLDLVREFSIEVLSQLPPGSTAAFLHPLRKRDWLMKDVLDQSPSLFYHLMLRVTASMGPPTATVHHEHLDRVADHVLSLGLSLVDAGIHLTPCMSGWSPWLPKETNRVVYRLGILERMSGRPTLPPKRAGEVVLATLLRDAILAKPDGEDIIWQYPPFNSLERFGSLAGIQRASLLVPGLPSSQQARLLRLALIACDGQPGADEFRAHMHQLVVDQALHGTDLEALALMACAFVRGGGANTTKSLERAVNLAPDAAVKKVAAKVETKAEPEASMEDDTESAAPPRAIASSPWIDDLRRALEPAKGRQKDVEMEASSSTTTTSPPPTESSSSRSAVDTPPAHSSRELVQALQRGGALANNPLKALTMEDLDGPQRLALFDGALAICAPLSVAEARAMGELVGKLSCTDTVKAQALHCLLRHAPPDFTAEGQRALWDLLAPEPKGRAPSKKGPAAETKASGSKPAGKLAVNEAAKQLLFAKDTPLDVLKVAYQVVVEDGNRAWDAVEKARKHTLAPDRRHLVERLDAVMARFAAAIEAAKKSPDPRAQQLEDEALGRIKTLAQARREFAGGGNLSTSSSSSSDS